MKQRNLVINVLLVIIMILVVAGCYMTYLCLTSDVQIINNNEKEKQIFSLENYPRIDGSTATLPLAQAFKADFTGTKIEEVNITHSKTHNAYVNLINGETDLILVTYPSEDELVYSSILSKYSCFLEVNNDS